MARSTNSRPSCLGQGADELLLSEQFVLDQHPGEVAASLLGAAQRLAQLVDGDDAALDEDDAELFVLGKRALAVTHPCIHGLPLSASLPGLMPIGMPILVIVAISMFGLWCPEMNGPHSPAAASCGQTRGT